MEYIDIDHRDKNFSKNEQGQETGLDAILQSYTKPRTNDAGLDLNPIDRLLNFCEYLSYITDEHLLNSAIKYVKTEVLLNNFDTDFDTLKQPLNREKHSDEDLIKIKAIIFSLRARFEIYKVVFNPSYINLPFFHIEFKNRIIEHNLEFAKGVILRNNDIDYKEQIKTLSLEDAKRLYNSRIENLEDLEHRHNTDISSKTIKYLKINKKRLIETKKSELKIPQHPTPSEKTPTILSDLITHEKSVEIIENIKIQYKNIKGKRLKLLLLAFQELELLPKERISQKFYDCCKIEFNWDIASYNALIKYEFNNGIDTKELAAMKQFLETLIKTD
jgi:hypothetical protein